VHYLCITPERAEKTTMMMEALARGCPGPHRVITGAPPDDGEPFVVWGQEWLTLRIVPAAVQQHRPFWTIDNGYWNPARGGAFGYYRLCYRGMSPVYLPSSADLRPARSILLRPWRHGGTVVVVAMPGVHFGLALGLDVAGWCKTIVERVRAATDRPVIIRQRDSTMSLDQQLNVASALVTHSSNVAVDAAIRGCPVFVEPTSAAAPIGRLDLDLEHPIRPGRARWLRSLASQHFTLDEMASGIAWHWMHRIARQVDDGEVSSA
jgi:hypothetical protein